MQVSRPVSRQVSRQAGKQASKQASTRKAFSWSHALEGLVYQSTPSCLKVKGGVMVGPCDFCVSSSPFDLDFESLDSGLTISRYLRDMENSILFFLFLNLPLGNLWMGFFVFFLLE